MYSSPATTPTTPLEAVGRSSSPVPKSTMETLDLADLTDNVSVASFGEAVDSNTSSNNVSSNLMKLETKGFIGYFERLPLAFKIILLVLCSSFGLVTLSGFAIGLSANMLHTTSHAASIISQSKLITDLIQALQDERKAARIMLQGVGTDLQVAYLRSIPITENAIASLSSTLSRNQDITKSFAALVAKRHEIDSIRARATAKTATVQEVLTAYHDVITMVLIMLHQGNSALGYGYDVSSIGAYSEYNEAVIVVLTFINIILKNPSTRSAMIRSLQWYLGERDASERILVNSGSDVTVHKLKQEVLDTPQKLVIDGYIQEIITCATSGGNYSFTFSQFDSAALSLVMTFDKIGDKLFSGDLQSHTNAASSRSIGTIAAVLLVVVFFAAASLSNAILFAKSIIGPWQRLNALQESTISKFVPKGFLSLMGWKSIAQATLGKCERKDVTIMIASIANFSKLESTLKDKPAQLFDFVNAYLAYVGPFVRSNGGYIDKFNSDHFVAIFQKDKRAIKAALEIQQSIGNFNKMQTIFGVAVRISLVTGNTSMGTIDENERMNSTFMSAVMRTAEKLQKIAKRANTLILTTRDTLGRLPNPKAIHHRYLGTVKLTRSTDESLGSCDLCEVLTFADPIKIKTKDHFTKAVRCLQATRLHDALVLFESIVQSNPSDTLAVKYRDLTKRSIAENLKRLTELSVTQVLQTPCMKAMLEEMCLQEHSMENINLWNQIQKFKECQSPEDRRLVASRICDEFLQLEGQQAVNLSEEQVSSVKRIVKNSNAVLTPLLFVELELQVEQLMVDTLKRLKHQQPFKVEFLNSSFAYKVTEIQVI